MRMTIRNGVAALAMFAFAACGGGGSSGGSTSGGPAPVPSPSPSPSPSSTPAPVGATDRIIYNVDRSMSFAVEWRYWDDLGFTIRYDNSTGYYWVNGLYNTSESVIRRSSTYEPLPGNPWQVFTPSDGGTFQIRFSGEFPEGPARYHHSNLAGFSQTPLGAYMAFGIPTPQGQGPSSQVTVYRGQFDAISDEKIDWGEGLFRDSTNGGVELVFDPLTNKATLALSPRTDYNGAVLGSPGPIQLSWTRAQSTFHQPDPTSATSLNYPVSGRFTGPNAEELIGGLRYSYVSKHNGKTYEMRGAFVAKR